MLTGGSWSSAHGLKPLMGFPSASDRTEAHGSLLHFVSKAQIHSFSAFFFYFLLKIPCWCNLFFTTEQGINTRNKVWVLSALGFCVKINHVCFLCGLVEQVREQRRCGHSCYLSFKAGKRYLSSFGLDKMIVALTQSTDRFYRFQLRLIKVWATKIQALGLAIIRQKSPEALKGKA